MILNDPINGTIVLGIGYKFEFVIQVAQQEAQRAQFVVEKAKQERSQKIVQAEGEAAAAKMVGWNDLQLTNV